MFSWSNTILDNQFPIVIFVKRILFYYILLKNIYFKEHQLEFKNENESQNTSLEKHALSESSLSLSITALTTHLKPSEKEFINNEVKFFYLIK